VPTPRSAPGGRRHRLIVFLKEPRPGQVKTRLGAALGLRAAADVYRALLRDTLTWVAKLTKDPHYGIELHFAPREASPDWLRAYVPAAPTGAWLAVPQPPGDLGRRLRSAFLGAFRRGAKSVCAVGTDCPRLGAQLVRQAMDRLRSADVVLGPARDGGYYLVALRAYRPEIFRGIPWSRSEVLERTVRAARKAGLMVSFLTELDDLDTVEDLDAVRQALMEGWGSIGRPQSDFPLWTFRELMLGAGARSLRSARRR